MTLTEADSILMKNLYLLKGHGAKRLIKEHFSPLWIHRRVSLVCIKHFTNKTTNNRMLFITERIRRRRALFIAYK